MDGATVSSPQQSRVLGISPDVRTAIWADCAARAPHEACGALVGSIDTALHAETAYALPNRAATTRSEYLIHASDLKPLEDEARAQGKSVVGFYHSHPSAAPVPSPRDIECAWPGYVYVIAGTRDGVACLQGWRLRDDRTGFDPVEVVCRS